MDSKKDEIDLDMVGKILELIGVDTEKEAYELIEKMLPIVKNSCKLCNWFDKTSDLQIRCKFNDDTERANAIIAALTMSVFDLNEYAKIQKVKPMKVRELSQKEQEDLLGQDAKTK